MKSMIKAALALLLALLVSLVICACAIPDIDSEIPDPEGEGNTENDTENNTSGENDIPVPEVLAYTLIEQSNTYTVSGIGTYKGTELIIPTEHEGKPVTAIGEGAFNSCKQLTSVTIPNSITEIASNAFAGCESITEITVPATVLYMGCGAFSGCSSLESITLPFVGETAQVNETSYLGYIFGCSVGYSQGAGFVPASLKSVTVTGGEIAAHAFFLCGNIETLRISNVTKIGEQAFSQCSALKSVTIGEGLTEIGKSAFDFCTALSTLSLPTSLTYIAVSTGMSSPFYWCKNLTYTEKDGMYFLGNEDNPYVVLTQASASLETAALPNGVKIISCGAFEKCQMLGRVVISDTVTQIGPKAFQSCRFLTDINIPDSVTVIGDYAFEHTAIYRLTLGGGVVSIGKGAFSCTELSQLLIPAHVKYVGESAFLLCPELASVTVASGATAFGSGAFSECAKLTEFVFPEGTTTISRFLFHINLTSGGLVTVEIPKTVTTIDEAAFAGCEGLLSIRYAGTMEEWKAISKYEGAFKWDTNTGPYTVYCSDGEIAK